MTATNTNSTSTDDLKTTVEIDDPADPSVKYEFRIPGIADNMKLGLYARALRRQYDPSGSGDLNGLDAETAMLSWACAAFETLLTSAGAKWPYSKSPVDGKPIVDHTKFPMDKLDTVIAVGFRLDAELARFREGWTANWKPAT